MRFFNFGAAIAAMAIGLVTAGVEAPHADDFGNLVPLRNRHKGKGQANRRGKGRRSKPRAKPNRLTISKRVRRKHRRAA